MNSAGKAHELMAAVGPALDLLVVDEYSVEGVWHVAVDETNVLFAELDRDRGVLVLSADVGTPQVEDRLKLYELLLHYNNCWELTYGVRLSIDAPGGAVCLLLDVVLDGMDNAEFSERMKNFAEKAAGWREIVAKFGVRSDDSASSLHSTMDFVIRG
jgi:hypothetical protein